jgi:aminoglycoside 3-N-acetyltransferase
MLSYHELSTKIQELKLPTGVPILVHSSMSAFGTIRGGAETVLGALFSLTDKIIFPAFTYRTMIIPEDGPPDNGMTYGSGRDNNAMAEFFKPDLPIDPLIGSVAEKLRLMPNAHRSNHPILSFTAINLDDVLHAQTLEDPLAPIQLLSDMEGWVILLGVDQSVNTSIHLAEKIADRKQFIRWALTPAGVVNCPGFPGCSDGFNKITPIIQDISHHATIGGTPLQAIPIPFLVDIARAMITSNPQALLCDRPDCERCNSIRNGWGS